MGENRQTKSAPQTEATAVITPEQARQLVAQENKRKAALCAAEIESVLAKHGCQMTATAYITAEGRIATQIRIETAQ